MDISGTRRYYEQLRAEALCQCAYCRNYMQQVQKQYPAIAAYLQSIGVDIEKPFETMPLEPDENGKIQYLGVQYLVMGSSRDFAPRTISGVSLRVEESHPSTAELMEEHFVIELSPMSLDWRIQA